MNTTLSSRERMLLAINRQEADHVPLAFHSFNWKPPNKSWNEGLDTWIWLSVPSKFHPEVTVKVHREKLQKKPHATLRKEYHTPAGVIHHAVRMTDDWPHGDDIPLCSDFNIPRSIQFPVADESDLAKIPYLYCEPDTAQLEAFRSQAEDVRRESTENQVIVTGDCGGFGDVAAWLMGITNLILAAVDRPDFVHALMDTILVWESRAYELLLDAGVADLLVHRGWYECSDFWPPPLYREFIAPRLEKQIKMVHDAGKKFGYIMSTGTMPLIDVFKKLDFDVLIHVDPVQGGADLPRLKAELGDRICFWGGVNSAVTLGRGTPAEIRQAVTHAVTTLAPGGGHILSAADVLFVDTPWRNVRTMIERWREIGSYPIS